MHPFKLIPALAALTALATAFQLPLHFPASYGHSPAAEAPQLSFPVPERSLAAVSSQGYTTLTHDKFARYAVRIRQTTGWCDPDVRSWTGYLDVDGGAKHLFFYFFESRRAPQEDPLLMWINGGPGCSAALGLLMELGPCKVNEHGNDTVMRVEAWNERANVFFLDQPVGVGFSYADYGEVVETTEDAARNVAAFVWIFTETFREYQGREFHMAGESYAGHYLPVLASAVVDQNKRSAARGLQEINLQSVMIGNGDTDYINRLPTLYDMACTNASVSPILDIAQCVRMKRAVPRCMQMATDSCIDKFDELACNAAMLFCSAELEEPIFSSGLNSYDITKPCDSDGVADSFCYGPVMKHIGDFLNMNSTRKLLGVDNAIERFTACSSEVQAGFVRRMDRYTPVLPYVTGLLERGVSILIYVGVYDPICNWIGNLAWTEALEWRGQEAYNGVSLSQWFVDGKPAGLTKASRGLTYATIDGAGHMVPYDKPVQALAMVNRWLEMRTL